MNSPVISALLPVVLLIAIGFISGRAGWIRPEASKDLSNLVFMVLTPALLFRTMSTVHVEQLDFKPVAMYFVAATLLFAAVLVWQGFTRRAAVLARRPESALFRRPAAGAVRHDGGRLAGQDR